MFIASAVLLCCPVSQEGLPFLLPHLTKQVIRLPVADFMRLLADRNVPLLIPSSAAGSEAETAAAAAAAKTPSNQVRCCVLSLQLEQTRH